MDTNLKHDNGSVTFILQMDVAGDTDEAREWVAERSVKTVFENNEDGTRRFDWFLTEDSTKAVLIEQFDDSDAAKIRVENLFASPLFQPSGRSGLHRQLFLFADRLRAIS